MKTDHSQRINNFYKALLTLKTPEECDKFFEDICTVKELQDISQRFEVAMMLDRGKVYTEIAAETGASTATISRVNRCYNYGSGGYKLAIERTKNE
ncbi:MAG: hypothetical protein IJ365_00505 [Clostridia bacterium]|nr:hypothetical protein [Clostridia bacterium]